MRNIKARNGESVNATNEIHDHHVKVLATKTEHTKWRKLAIGKKSLSAIGAELFNKECDKRGIK